MIPEGFVERCVEGLRGGRPEREALFNYLEAQPIRDEGFAALLKTVKLALLGSNPQKLGKDLMGDTGGLAGDCGQVSGTKIARYAWARA